MKSLSLFSLLLFSIVFLYAQTPPRAFTYQAIVRNASGNPIPNQAVALRFSISDGGSTIYYIETQSTTSNQFGLISVAVGRGTAAFQSFDAIPWGGGDKYLGTEMDITNSGSYINMGAEQLLSVPFALYAGGTVRDTGGGANANGTANYLSKFNTATSLTNSQIFDDGTNVGIGTTQPAYLLDVKGSAASVSVLASTNTNGVGIVGLGNNLGSFSLPPTGAGGAFYGTNTGGFASASAVQGIGLFGIATDISNSYGIVGAGNGEVAMGLTGGAGGAFTGNIYGVIGIAKSYTAPLEAGGAFQSYTSATNTSSTYVEAWMSNIHYKIVGGGAVSTSVPDGMGNRVVLHAPETPEYYFQDYGEGKLVNGRAHIDIDPIYARNVVVNDKHPLRVFVQLQGDCNGVFVTNQSATGFDVVELKGGTTNTKFTWSITCNVADEQTGDRISKFSDLRFEKMPVNLPQVIQAEKKTLPK